MPNIKRVAKRQFVEEEVEVDGPDSPDVEEIVTEKERSELNDWTNDSPNVNCSACSQCSLDAIRRKKARKAVPFPSTSNVEKSEEEEEEEEEGEDADQQRRRELLRKLQEAKQEARDIEAGNFVSPRVRCPLCHTQMSESTTEMGETHLWCPNKCILPYKPSNEKARYLGELSARISSKYVNPRRPPDCIHGETCALTHMANSEKVKEELRDVLFFICPKKVSEGRCNFVAAAEEADPMESEFLETLYRNRNEKINKFAEENRKANENSFQLGLEAAMKKKKDKMAKKKGQ